MKRFSVYILIILFLVCSNAQAAMEQTLIIFDASISMNDNFYGNPKYVTAVKEAKKVLSTMGNDRNIGLRTIGVKLDATTVLNYLQDPNSMCKATQLDVPIRTNNISYINNTLDEVFPLGTTPLEYTLRTAIQYDFINNNTQLKHIILITDGGESCGGDPCRFIKEVIMHRNDIKIDVIAISVNGDEFNQLQCLAGATNGSILNVSNPSELQNAYSKILPSYNSQYSTTPQNITQMPNNNQVKRSMPQITYKNYQFETFD
ncbi:VWA domain-containing protein [bacterium]|nr:VWA domain-containing protein [bacterium]